MKKQKQFCKIFGIIDEGSNLGAIRIRIRSLKATVEKKDNEINLSHCYEQKKK
mgnify:CR=1 FL=1